MATKATTPKPPRNLNATGLAVWRWVWTSPAREWLDRATDVEAVLLLCEAEDERAELRTLVALDGDWRNRSALRTIDTQIANALTSLGLTPAARTKLDLDKPQDAFGQLMDALTQSGE